MALQQRRFTQRQPVIRPNQQRQPHAKGREQAQQTGVFRADYCEGPSGDQSCEQQADAGRGPGVAEGQRLLHRPGQRIDSLSSDPTQQEEGVTLTQL